MNKKKFTGVYKTLYHQQGKKVTFTFKKVAFSRLCVNPVYF